MDIKLCKDCRHAIPDRKPPTLWQAMTGQLGDEDWYYYPHCGMVGEFNVVLGTRKPESCLLARCDYDHKPEYCGAAARFWEPRTSTPPIK